MGFPVNWIPSQDPGDYWSFLSEIESQYGESLYSHAIFRYIGAHPNTLYFEDWTTVSGVMEPGSKWLDYLQVRNKSLFPLYTFLSLARMLYVCA